MMSSVMPSLKYSRFVSPLRFVSGSTATMGKAPNAPCTSAAMGQGMPTTFAILGSATCAWALAVSSFALYCLGTAIIGIYTAFGLQYRFAAAEVAAPEFKAKAISLVLAGGIAGGFLGPEASRWGRELLPVPFLGSFLVMSAFALVAMGVQSRVRVPRPALASPGGARSLGKIAVQPVFVVAVLAAALGYGECSRQWRRWIWWCW